VKQSFRTERKVLNVHLSEALAAVMNLEKGDRVSWKVLERSKLELDID
jgi:hypothetical protein